MSLSEEGEDERPNDSHSRNVSIHSSQFGRDSMEILTIFSSEEININEKSSEQKPFISSRIS